MKKFYYDIGFITKMTTKPMYGKNLLNNLLLNKWTDFHDLVCRRGDPGPS